MQQFLARFGAPAPLTWELFDDEVVRRANALSFGRAQMPTFDLANARFVLSFGADFLGTWNSPVSQSHAYGAMRQGRRGIRGAFVQVEARMSQTGANADQWVPVRPGTDAVLALGLAHALMAAKVRTPADAGRAGALIEGWSAGLPDYAPDAVEKQTGVAAAKIERLAAEMAEMRPAVAMIGGPALAHTNGLFAALAVNALNALLGSVDQPGGVSFTPQWNVAAAAKATASPAAASASLERLAAAVLAGDAAAPQVLLLDGANPVFTAPKAWRVREAFEKVPYIVSFGSFLDETSGLADLILPDHSFLESWADHVPESGSLVGVASVAPPAMAPLHQTRATADVLLDVSRRLQTPLDLPWESMEALARRHLRRAAAGRRGRRCVERGAGEGRLVGHVARAPRGRAAGRACAARAPLRRRSSSRSSTATRRSSRSTSCPTRRPRSTTAPPRTCRGCRRCRTR